MGDLLVESESNALPAADELEPALEH